MQIAPFSKPGRFYRGNLHTHSNESDGTLTPAEVGSLYRNEGYDFISLTDHFSPYWDYRITDATSLRTDDFTTITGAELHTEGLSNGLPWHIVAVGLPLDFAATGPRESGPELAARAAGAGAFVGIAHPAWYGLLPEEARSLEAAHAVEVFNTTCSYLNDAGDSWYMADLLLSEGRRITAYGADDLHATIENRLDAFGAWVWVRAASLEPDVLVEALIAGNYYTSQGPRIHDLRIESNEIHISCSPASDIYLTGSAARFEFSHGHRLTGARFSTEKFAGSYCRATIVDHAGKRAWSNPIWLE